MKKEFCLFASSIVISMFSAPIMAEDFEYGMSAYKANEYDIARQTWMPLALQDNDKRAQFYLGEIFSGAMGVPLDNIQALTWYKLAAKQNYIKAQTRLGSLYERGLGTEKDDKNAFNWYLKAAKKADVVAQYKLGFLYAEGRGVKKNLLEAYKWWGIAALWGDPDAHIERNKLGDILSDAQILKLDNTINLWVPD